MNKDLSIKWKSLKGYEGIYELSTEGVICRIDKFSYKSPKTRFNSYGREQVQISKKYKRENCFVDLLVAKTFIDNPNNWQFVRHIDGNIRNSRVNNLEWVEFADDIPTNFGEVWKDVVGYEGKYKVSNQGRVFSLTRTRANGGNVYRGRILKGEYCRGYYCVALLDGTGKTKLNKVHRLVATAFIPNPMNKPQIDHIDGNPRNNNVWNLRWATARENVCNPITLSRRVPLITGGKNPMAIRTVSVNLSDGTIRIYGSSSEATIELGVKDSKYIRECCNGKMESYKGRKWYNLDDYEEKYGKIFIENKRS